MRFVITLVPIPGEYLADKPDSLLALGLAAVRIATEAAAALPGEHSVIVACSGMRTADSTRLGKEGAELLDLGPEPGAAPPLAFLPPGAMEALRVLAPPSQRDPVLLVNPRNPRLEPGDLLAAAQTLDEGDAHLVISATPPADHPCQGKMLHAKAAPARPLGQGAHIEGDGNGQSVTLDACAPERAFLLLFGEGKIIFLHQRADEQAEGTAFVLPPEAEPPANARWILTLPADTPGPGRFLLPYIPPGAPWGIGLHSGRVTGLHGDLIAGRQDFPPLLTACGSFCLLRHPLPAPGEAALLPHRALELPEARSQLIANALQDLAWQLECRER